MPRMFPQLFPLGFTVSHHRKTRHIKILTRMRILDLQSVMAIYESGYYKTRSSGGGVNRTGAVRSTRCAVRGAYGVYMWSMGVLLTDLCCGGPFNSV